MHSQIQGKSLTSPASPCSPQLSAHCPVCRNSGAAADSPSRPWQGVLVPVCPLPKCLSQTHIKGEKRLPRAVCACSVCLDFCWHFQLAPGLLWALVVLQFSVVETFLQEQEQKGGVRSCLGNVAFNAKCESGSGPVFPSCTLGAPALTSTDTMRFREHLTVCSILRGMEHFRRVEPPGQWSVFEWCFPNLRKAGNPYYLTSDGNTASWSTVGNACLIEWIEIWIPEN